MEEKMNPIVITINRLLANRSCTIGSVTISETNYIANTIEPIHKHFIMGNEYTRLMGCHESGEYELRTRFVGRNPFQLCIKGTGRALNVFARSFQDVPPKSVGIGSKETNFWFKEDDKPYETFNKIIAGFARKGRSFKVQFLEDKLVFDDESYEDKMNELGWSDDIDDDDNNYFVEDD